MRDFLGNTVLHKAASLGRLDYVKVLLEKGADLNVKNEWGHTPLTKAKLFSPSVESYMEQ